MLIPYLSCVTVLSPTKSPTSLALFVVSEIPDGNALWHQTLNL